MSRTSSSLLVTLVVLTILVVGLLPQSGQASSHREAPLISLDPTADNTDVYAFVSPDKPDTVTLIANYIPLEEPAGGPYFSNFDDNVRYEIKIDTDGDGEEDISYQFRFETKIRNKDTFLYNTGPITSLDDEDWNYRQIYNVIRDDDETTEELGDDIPVAPANIGPRSTPNYQTLAAAAVTELDDGSRVFVGPRDDPFFVDTGSIFDLAGLRPLNPAHIIPLDSSEGVDGLSGFNVHTIALQVPIERLANTEDGADEDNRIIGVYASASRQRTRILRTDGSMTHRGSWIQVSRLANPLINEVVIPLRNKDRWNASHPEDDKQFVSYYRTPELATLAGALYPVLEDPRTSGRDDLVQILLTGVPGLNFTGDTPADLLRLNMAIPPSAAVGAGARLGVLDGDLAGFPNGRRLEDDVTDIELRAVADGYGTFLNTNFGLPNLSPNNTIGDGVDQNDVPFLTTFPYVGLPHQGYEHLHSHGGGANPGVR